MRRARVTSAAWTVLFVGLATLALFGIIRFMATVHDSMAPGRSADHDTRSPSTAAERPAATRGRGAEGAPTGRGEAGASIGPARPSPSGPPSAAPTTPRAAAAVVDLLRQRRLTIPVRGIGPRELTPSFTEARGNRVHEAIDIMSPTGTPVLAVEDGVVAKLFTSEAGGLTIYQFDPSRTVAYYYAHLDRYADGLDEGEAVRRGQVIGYVGATGNADPNAPHLHFAIFRLGPERRWSEGTPIDPYLVLR